MILVHPIDETTWGKGETNPETKKHKKETRTTTKRKYASCSHENDNPNQVDSFVF